jgi:hypothetical protein
MRDNELLGACSFVYRDQPVVIQVRLLRSKPTQHWTIVEGGPEAVDQRNWDMRKHVYVPELVSPVCNMLLDCAKIRSRGWEALATPESCRPTPYQMPLDAMSSEDNAVSEDALST